MSDPMTPEVRDLVSQAAQWRLLGLLFERPRDEWRDEVRALSTCCEDPRLREAAERAAGEGSEPAYLALLGPGGVASPREAAASGFHDPGAILSELNSFYTEFAFSHHAEEPPDHVAVETAFTGYLYLKRAYAIAGGNEEEGDVTAEATAAFIERHLAATVGSLARKRDLLAGSYLGSALELLRDKVPAVTLPEGGSLFDQCGNCPGGGFDDDSH